MDQLFSQARGLSNCSTGATAVSILVVMDQLFSPGLPCQPWPAAVPDLVSILVVMDQLFSQCIPPFYL